MKTWRLIGGCLVSALALTVAAYAVEQTAPSPEDRLAEILDPAQMARTVCKGLRGANRSAFKPVRMASTTLPAETQAEPLPPLWDDLGDFTFPVTTANAQAQAYFDQGIKLTYGFNHAEAARAFRAGQRLDPGCAMCYWGEAMVLGPNINAPMLPEAVEPAFAAIAKAQALAKNVSAKEQALIAAMATRYSIDPAADRAKLDWAYSEAMAEVAARYPDDVGVQTLYAEAIMDTQPWDYWEADMRTPKGRAQTVIDTLERVLDAEPDYPGAIHLYIHIVEASTTPTRAEPYADRLAAQGLGAGHLVHMPAHIYLRVGRYMDSLNANIAAAKADEAYFAQAEPSGIYQGGYYPHNVHFVLVSAQMAGAKDEVMRSAEKLAGVVSDEMAAAVGWVQSIKQAPYFAHAQFADPATILSLPDPGDRFGYVKASWHYARAVGLINRGDEDAALAEKAAIAAIADANDFALLTAFGVPGHAVLELAMLVIDGRMAQARGDYDHAVETFRAAVEIQDQLRYTEPPHWYYPVRQSLGAALVQAGRPQEAEKVLTKSLINHPNNGWALYALMEARRAAGDEAGAKATEKLLAKAWAGERAELTLGRL